MKIHSKFNFHSMIIRHWYRNGFLHIFQGGGQNFERRNVERLIFRNLKIANIKITKNDLFDSFIIKLIFSFLEII